MDFEISFIDDDQIAVIKTSGCATLKGFHAYLKALTSDTRWRPGMDVLSDHSDLDLSSMPTQELEELTTTRLSQATWSGEGLERGLLALVFGATPLRIGLGRKYESYAEYELPFQVRAFGTADEALAWLRKERAAR